MTRENAVWVSPSATAFSCLCELCLEAARADGLLFGDAVAHARVHGDVSPAALVLAVRCPRGHEIVVRRMHRPPTLPARDERQLQLV
jgi:hypothetical protein